MADLQKRMAQRQLTVTLTDAAKDYLIAKGYDPIYGARPLKRLIQTEVETLPGGSLLRTPPPRLPLRWTTTAKSWWRCNKNG